MRTDINYSVMTDEEIVSRIQAGDCPAMDFLLEKYKFLVRNKAKSFVSN